MDLDSLPIIVFQRKGHSTVERRLEYHCEHCGFKGIARVYGRGTVAMSLLASASEVEAAAYSVASAEGDALFALRKCPQCGKRNRHHSSRYQLVTWLMMGGAAAGAIAILVLANQEKTSNAIVNIILGIVGIGAIASIPFFRRTRLIELDQRVRFLSTEELAAEAEQAAKDAVAREEARQARARQQRDRAKRRSRL